MHDLTNSCVFFVILCAEFISTTIGMNKLLYIKYAEVYNHHDDESQRSLRTTHWQPYEGYVRRFVESERLYFSILSIEHVKGYNEIGYGFKCRYFSTAFFASFLDRRYNSFECKFTIELFNRW